MLKVPTWEITEMVGPESTLVRSGLLGARDMPFAMEAPSPFLQAALTLPAKDDADFIERFVKKLEVKPSTASLARLDERDEKILVKVLRLAVPESGVHALVYGSRGIDKNDLLARILSREHFEAYSVASTEVLGRDLAAWVYIAQRYLITEKPNAVLVVERAEQVLASKSFSMLSLLGISEEIEDDVAASDAGLTGAKLRCIWLTDRGRSLSENNLGRFLLHCEARPGSRADRRERVAAIIKEAGMGEGMGSYLSRYSLLAEQPVRQAVRLADLVCDPEDVESREDIIRRAVSQSQRVLGRDATEDLRDSVTVYDLNMLNLSSKFSPQQIVTALQKKQKGTLLFHGIPGAGKTQFAEYLAVELDKPLLIKRASDILDKYVGGNEQNIANAFAEAEESGAILFIDEADSFLRDRMMARAEWSVSMVNEFLQHIERAEGVVVCATNLMGDIDTAAMRRFTFKIEFKALRDEQAWHMFCVETGISPEALGVEEAGRLQERLRKIKDLAPGDFATVKRMSLILDDDVMSPEDWLDQLEKEAKDKMAGLRRAKLGFGQD
jgi:SpoVK/Ycf46/Vps4 family AAA+-type ATPase